MVVDEVVGEHDALIGQRGQVTVERGQLGAVKVVPAVVVCRSGQQGQGSARWEAQLRGGGRAPCSTKKMLGRWRADVSALAEHHPSAATSAAVRIGLSFCCQLLYLPALLCRVGNSSALFPSMMLWAADRWVGSFSIPK